MTSRPRSSTKRKQEAEYQARAMAADALRIQLQNLHVFEKHPFWPQFVPFGVGQFNNGDYGKGGLFAAGELVTFRSERRHIPRTAHLTYGLHSTNVPFADSQTVLTLQRVEIGTGIAFFALWGVGIFDAHRHYKREVRVPNSEKLLRELDPGFTVPSPPPKPVKTTLRLGPLAVPNGGGIGLSWETP